MRPPTEAPLFVLFFFVYGRAADRGGGTLALGRLEACRPLD
jgi:hypothetical protein